MATVTDKAAITHTNGSDTPTTTYVISQSTPTTAKPIDQTGVTGPSTALPPVEKKRKPTRASTLLSALAPPFTRRLGRARSLVRPNGEPVIDVHALLVDGPPKESAASVNTAISVNTVEPNGVGGQRPENGGAAAPQIHDDKHVDELERKDTVVLQPGKNGDLTKSMRRISRRFSDVGAQKVGSAIGSIKRRMGLGKDSNQGDLGNLNNALSGESLGTPLQEVPTQNDAPRQEMGLSPPKDGGGGLMRKGSFRDRFRRSRVFATDTFEFAASAKQADGSIKDDHSANPVFVDSPVNLQEGDAQASKRTSMASSRPHPLHTNSTPANASISSKKKYTATLNSTEIREEAAALVDMTVPKQWLQGTEMYKVSEKGKKMRRVILDPDQGYILWESKKSGISE